MSARLVDRSVSIAARETLIKGVALVSRISLWLYLLTLLVRVGGLILPARNAGLV